MATTYQAIASQVLASTAASVTFSSIPSTYTDLVLKISARNDTGNAFSIQINGDTATNYSDTYVGNNNGSAVSGRDSTQTSTLFRLSLPNSGDTANTFTCNEIYIPNYAATTTKQFILNGQRESNSTSVYAIGLTSSLYRGTSAISSILISTVIGAGYLFVAGSRFDIYGITHI